MYNIVILNIHVHTSAGSWLGYWNGTASVAIIIKCADSLKKITEPCFKAMVLLVLCSMQINCAIFEIIIQK